MKVTDTDLEALRLQARLMSTGGQNSAPSWAQVAEALEELRERREREKNPEEKQP